MKDFDLDGDWWIPGERRRRSGRLTFRAKEGATLTVTGSLTKEPGLLHKPIILGQSTKARKVTLYTCREVRRSHPTDRLTPASSVMKASVVFINQHFRRPTSLRFRGIGLRYTHLRDWYGRRGMRAGPFPTLSYSAPQPVLAQFGDFRASVGAGYSTTIGDFAYKFEEDATVWITLPDKTRQIDYWRHEVAFTLQTFLTLCIGRPIHPTAFIAFPTDDPVEAVEVFHGVPGVDDEISGQPDLRDELLLVCDDVADNLSHVLGSWFGGVRNLKPVYELYAAVMYSPRMYLQFQFLGLMQCLEAYLSRTGDGSHMSKAAFKRIMDRLLASIPGTLPKDTKDSFRATIRYMNRLSLRARLRRLVRSAESIVRPLVPVEATRREAFINLTVDTRNFLTHYSAELEKVAARGTNLARLLFQVRLLLEVCLLRAAGLDDGMIGKVVRRTKRYEWLYSFV